VTEYTDYTTDAGVLADLAERAQIAETLDPDGSPLYTVGPDGHAHILDGEAYRTSPRRTKAARTFADAASLLAYLRRHDPRPETEDSAGATPSGYPSRFTGDPDPDARAVTLWASERQKSVTAILDDSHNGVPGWAQHTATLQLEHDEDWLKWTRRNAALMDQETAAEFVEDLLHTVVEPDAADLLEIVSTLQIHRQMVVGQTVRLNSGATQITYSDDDTAGAGRSETGTLTVPNRIVVRVGVFVGAAPVEFSARFRYRQAGRALKVAYIIDRLRLVEREAFAKVVAEIVEAGRPVLFGTP
jgi:hypothetical protein